MKTLQQPSHPSWLQEEVAQVDFALWTNGSETSCSGGQRMYEVESRR